MAVASVKVTGNVTEAIAALESLGIKAETVSGHTESTFDHATTKVGNAFTKLGTQLGNWGVPFSDSLTKMGEKIEAADSKAAKLSATMSAVSKVVAVSAVAGFGVAAYEGIKAATKFQSATELLVTAGGEAQKNLGKIRDGILSISDQTGTAAESLADGMYIAEKAGYRAAAGLNVLKMAAEGAAGEHVDLATATNALTDVMTDYHLSASKAAAAENMIVAASGRSKTTMADFAGSLSSVVPLASSLHISFAQVGGAIASMTQHGESAQQATQNLSNLITNLAGQNNVATAAMGQLGITTTDLDKKLGQRGLTGTLQYVMDKIANSSKDGMVVVSAFKKSATATADLKKELDAMPPSLRAMSEQFSKGTMGYSDYYKAVKALGGQQYEMGKGFISTVAAAKGFNTQLSSGSAAVRTTATELRALLGGMTGMKTALMLTGENAKTFTTDVGKIGEAGKKSGASIAIWKKQQGQLGQQLRELEETVKNLSIKLGEALLPAATKVTSALLKFANFLSDHKDVLKAFGLVVGSVLTAALGSFAAEVTGNFVTSLAKGFGSIGTFIGGLFAAQAAEEETAAVSEATGGGFGPVGMAIGLLVPAIVELVEHWSTVKQVFIEVGQKIASVTKDAFDKVKSAVSTAFDWVKGHWPLLAGILTGPIGLAVVEIATHWKQITAGARNVLADVKKVFGNVGSMLFDSGKALINGFADGIKAAIGTAYDAAKGVLSKISNLWPHSPAKEGPFSGKGWTGYSGRALAKDFADGIISNTDLVENASKAMMTKLQNSLKVTSAQLSAAKSVASSLDYNVFTAGLATTGTKTKTGIVNGLLTTTTATSKLTNAQILKEMTAALEGQEKQAKKYAVDMAKLQKLGASKSVLSQVGQGGTAGLPYINAVLSGGKAEVARLDKIEAQLAKAANTAGAESVGAKSLHQLQSEKQQEKSMETALDRALHKKPIEVVVKKPTHRASA